MTKNMNTVNSKSSKGSIGEISVKVYNISAIAKFSSFIKMHLEQHFSIKVLQEIGK